MSSLPPDTPLLSATELLGALARREFSSRELLDLYLERIATVGADVNAVVTVDAEGARRRADAADAARAAGQSWGPLHGLPITIKDELEVEGMRATFGVTDFRDHVSDYDAAAVAGLRAAGAIVFGKSNLPPWSADLQSLNDIFGVTNNPWDLDRTCGGSSGGSAAALAAGLTGMELGTDMGGSIRIPSNWCGVYGLKPTGGLVSQFGDVGESRRYAQIDLFSPGPMGRGAADLALGLEAIVGWDAGGKVTSSAPLPRPRISTLQGARVAAWLDDPACAVDGSVLEVIEAAVGRLRDAGCQVDTEPPLPLPTAEMILIWERLFAAAGWAGLEDEIVEVEELAAREGDRFPIARIFADAARMSHADWLLLDEDRARLGVGWASFFRDYDVLLCPVTVVPAPLHCPTTLMHGREIEVNGQVRPYWDLYTWIGLTTVAKLPALSAPIGVTEEGLPVGLQVAGARGADLTTIEFARLMEPVVGGFAPPPSLFSAQDRS